MLSMEKTTIESGGHQPYARAYSFFAMCFVLHAWPPLFREDNASLVFDEIDTQSPCYPGIEAHLLTSGRKQSNI